MPSLPAPKLAPLTNAAPPGWASVLPPHWHDDLARHAIAPMQIPQATTMFDEGAACRGFPWVMGGEIQVARGSVDGRILELYRVTPGEICLLSTASLLGNAPLSAHGRTTQPTTLMLIPPSLFLQWTDHRPFREWIFHLFAARMGDLMALAEAVAFQRLDQRLAQAIWSRGPTLQITHQGLADELGTVREMVTRLLRRFEQEGWVALGRERIDILDAEALRGWAHGTHT